MAERGRFFAIRGCADRHIVRHQPGHPRRRRRLDAGSGRRLLAYTRSVGGSIAAAEFMNEPDLAEMGGAPAGYDAAAYGRDFRLFRTFMKQTAPETMILGPGTVGETALASRPACCLRARPGWVSYHYYGDAVGAMQRQGHPEAALSEDWLSRTDRALAFYRTLRDRFEPGKPIWLTETADAACGGNPWAATFLDTFRYLDQLGRLAKAGVQVVMHNTLAASDYGLLDEKTLAAQAELLGRIVVAAIDGNHGARRRRADSIGSSCLCPLPKRHAGRRCCFW